MVLLQLGLYTHLKLLPGLFAHPIKYQKQIPVIGEHVLIFEGTDEYGNLDTTRRQWYYFPPYGIQSGINSNPLPGISNSTNWGCKYE